MSAKNKSQEWIESCKSNQDGREFYQEYLGYPTYIPEMITVEKFFLLHDLKFSVEAGLEYAQECLIRHGQELGRTTKKNKSWAEIMERDINYMKVTLERINKYEKSC